MLEGKGDCSAARLQKYQHVMLSLWEEIAQLADFDKVPDYVGWTLLFSYYSTHAGLGYAVGGVPVHLGFVLGIKMIAFLRYKELES